jgi:hypothetical protein
MTYKTTLRRLMRSSRNIIGRGAWFAAPTALMALK